MKIINNHTNLLSSDLFVHTGWFPQWVPGCQAVAHSSPSHNPSGLVILKSPRSHSLFRVPVGFSGEASDHTVGSVSLWPVGSLGRRPQTTGHPTHAGTGVGRGAQSEEPNEAQPHFQEGYKTEMLDVFRIEEAVTVLKEFLNHQGSLRMPSLPQEHIAWIHEDLNPLSLNLDALWSRGVGTQNLVFISSKNIHASLVNVTHAQNFKVVVVCAKKIMAKSLLLLKTWLHRTQNVTQDSTRMSVPNTHPQNSFGQGRQGTVSDVYTRCTQVRDGEPNEARPNFQEWYKLNLAPFNRHVFPADFLRFKKHTHLAIVLCVDESEKGLKHG